MNTSLEVASGVFTAADLTPVVSEELIGRICEFYRRSVGQVGDHRHTGESQWTTINSWKSDAHQALMTGSGARDILSTPSRSNILLGFENIFPRALEQLKSNPEAQRYEAVLIKDCFSRLMQALAIQRHPNPEAPDREVTRVSDIETGLRLLDDKLAMHVTFPNPFADEFGLKTGRGVVSLRPLFALYHARMLHELLKRTKSKSVCEIGGGVGRTAYYSYLMGIRDYTLVDLPLTSAMQAYFLARTLGEDSITLQGEPPRGSISIVNATGYQCRNYGVTTCVDALTEMEHATASIYMRYAAQHSDAIYVISHEVNEFSASDLIANMPSTASWFHFLNEIRPGYIEDVIIF